MNRWHSLCRDVIFLCTFCCKVHGCTNYRRATDMFIEFADGEGSNTDEILWIYSVRTPVSLVPIFLPPVII